MVQQTNEQTNKRTQNTQTTTTKQTNENETVRLYPHRWKQMWVVASSVAFPNGIRNDGILTPRRSTNRIG